MEKEVKAKTTKKAAKQATEGVFNFAQKSEALKQYLRAYLFNQRQGTSKTKNRGEVSGSGAKPWRQKGTGRARVGSKRTPIWRHGGIVFGPQPKSWNLTTTKALKNIALQTALSLRSLDNAVVTVADFDGLKGKAKDGAKLISDNKFNRRTLVVAQKLTPEIRKSLQNLKLVELADVSRLNAFQVVRADHILLTEEAVKSLQKRLGK